MELSPKVKYALLALLELATHYEQGNLLQIDQIATSHQIPERYLAQQFMELRRCGIVRSQRGTKGGYLLARDPQQITVMEVLTCLEGTKILESESQTEFQTKEIFVIEEVWQEGNSAARAVFERYTLQDLREKRDQCQWLNNMYYI